jgi:hypothetical protein
MAGNNVTTTGIVSKSGTLVVDSVPETSNSDISGSINPFEETKNSVKWCWDLNDWIQLILQSPLLIGVIVGFAVALVLILATTCVIVSICRLVLFKPVCKKLFVKLHVGE